MTNESRNGSSNDTVVRTQVGTLVAALRRDIVAGTLAPGSKLKIADVAARYDSGLVPTREALSRLVSSGLVLAYEQRGFRVAPISIPELMELSSLRRLLETKALRESLANADLEWETRVIAAQHRLSRLPRRGEGDTSGYAQNWVDAHREFHMALLSNCKSKWLMHMVHLLSDQTNRYRHLFPRSMSSGSHGVSDEHLALLEAALARDVEGASALLIKHFSTIETNVLAALREREDLQNGTCE